MGELSALACAGLWACSTIAMRSQTARVPAEKHGFDLVLQKLHQLGGLGAITHLI